METKTMRVKVPTALKVRNTASFDGKVLMVLENKTIIEIGETVNGWARLKSYYTSYYPQHHLFGRPKFTEHPLNDLVAWVCVDYLKECRKPLFYG